jgi:hypothetical protein
MKLFISLLIVAFFILFGFSRCQKQVLEGVTDTVANHGSSEYPGQGSNTISLQPGPGHGMDCLVASLPIYAPYNLISNPDLVASQWTYMAQGYDEGTVRGYIEFVGLDSIPTGVTIDSARLSLYGLDPYTGTASPEGNSNYPGSPYNSYGDNTCWLKRVTGSWNQDSINWYNMPPTTDSSETAVQSSTLQWNNNVTVDVTKLVQDIVDSKHNFGFCLMQQTEQIYRSLNFAGSRNPDPSKWPKLVISYTLH